MAQATVHTIIDPKWGTWTFEESTSLTGNVFTSNMTYTSPTGETVTNLYSTTGFINEGAIVAYCEEFDNNGDCDHPVFGIMRKDGTMALDFGYYEFPEFRIFKHHDYDRLDLRSQECVQLWAFTYSSSVPINLFPDDRILIQSPETGRIGVVNSKGEVIVEPNYLAIASYENKATVAIDEEGFWGTMDLQGNFKRDPYRFMNLRNDLGGYIFTMNCIPYSYKDDYRYRKLNKTMAFASEVVLDPKDDSVCKEELSPAQAGLLNSKEAVILESIYDHVFVYNTGDTRIGHYIMPQKDGKIAVFLLNGKYDTKPVTDFVYDSGSFVNEDSIKVYKDGLVGLIYKGIEVYPPMFQTIGDFDNEGMAMASMPGWSGKIFLSREHEKAYYQRYAPKHPMTPPPMPRREGQSHLRSFGK